MITPRLPVVKAYKLFINGAFLRSESNRIFSVKSASGKLLAHASRASRKDLLNSVVAAQKALEGWKNRSSMNRGQIFYRIAELLECRSMEMMNELHDLTQLPRTLLRREVQLTIDRLIWYAGWADKIVQYFGHINFAAEASLGYSIPEPVGVVAVIAPDTPAILGLISTLAPILISGNTTVVLASEKCPFSSITLSEIFATSDLPPGVTNILTGFRSELAVMMAQHMDIHTIVDASNNSSLRIKIQQEALCNLKPIFFRDFKSKTWFEKITAHPNWMLDTLKIKTTCHSVGF